MKKASKRRSGTKQHASPRTQLTAIEDRKCHRPHNVIMKPIGSKKFDTKTYNRFTKTHVAHYATRRIHILKDLLVRYELQLDQPALLPCLKLSCFPRSVPNEMRKKRLRRQNRRGRPRNCGSTTLFLLSAKNEALHCLPCTMMNCILTHKKHISTM